jgi:hypothetical protein
MPSKRSSETISLPPKCEDCRHFSGSAFSLRFGCAKEHAPDSTYSMNRDKCEDRSPFTRQEVIFKRFQHAPWTGETELKNQKTTALRTATSLRKALTNFEQVLTSEQATALRDAASALDQLGRDIELAGQLLKQEKQNVEARHERERVAQLDQIASKYFEAEPAYVLALADDLVAFYSGSGLEWFRNHSQDPRAYFRSSQLVPGAKAQKYRMAPGGGTLVELRRECAACLEEMGVEGRYCSSSEPRFADFQAFRAWVADNKALMRRLSTGAAVRPSPPATP